MGKLYVLQDGTPIFITPKDPANPPTQEQVQEGHDKYVAMMAARDPEAIRYGESLWERRLEKDLGLRELTALTGIGPVDLSAIERGKRFPTDDERALIEAALGGSGNG